jgi:hypothetical protein
MLLLVAGKIHVNQGGIQAKTGFYLAKCHWTIEMFGIKENEYSYSRMHSSFQPKT